MFVPSKITNKIIVLTEILKGLFQIIQRVNFWVNLFSFSIKKLAHNH